MMVLILGVQLVSLLPYLTVVTARYLREEYVSSDVKKVRGFETLDLVLLTNKAAIGINQGYQV